MQLFPLAGFGFVTELFFCRYVTSKNPPIGSIRYSFTCVFIWLSFCYRLGLPISKDSNLELPWWSGGKNTVLPHRSGAGFPREKWYRWTSLQGRNRDTDVGNGHMDVVGVGMNWEIGINVCALPCIKQRASGNPLTARGAQLRSLWWHRWMGWGLGGMVKRKGIHIYTQLFTSLY